MTGLGALLQRRHEAANRLYEDLIDAIDADRLHARIPGVRSSPVRNHFWCVVGARESYVRAARAGAWQGFESSLTDDGDPAAVRAALGRTAGQVTEWLAALQPGDEAGWEWALHLLEHEAQHHGQLIRYLYGVPLPIPRSWVDQYALEET